MIKDFQPRIYQQTILASAVEKNTLVVLPTGLGKTYIFLMLAAQRLKKYPESKILLLGPTKPLISQYFNIFERHFEIDINKMAIFTGQVKPEKRQELWKTSKIIFSTPQGLENDLISNRISLENVSLLGFDEAHRATGDYSYVWIADQYKKKARHERILALTASPGNDIEKITEVITNLKIENVEIRTEDDPDVKPYIQDIKIKWHYVELPDHFKRIQKYLKDCFLSKIESIKKTIDIKYDIESKSSLLSLQKELLSNLKEFKDYDGLRAISFLAQAMKVQHALELLESQGISPLLDYMNDLFAKAHITKVKAVKNLVKDLNFRSAYILAKNLGESNIVHPKIKELKKILSENKENKVIVFSQYRDTIIKIVSEINKLDGIKAEMFVGQQKKRNTGLSQKQQINLINDFREGLFNVLVMSSVGEEGLDIPAVDLVVFYEPVPSAIRTIQRRGRTGRQKKGMVIVLVSKNTKDEGYRWSAFHKENRMNSILRKLKESFSRENAEKKEISELAMPNGIEIFADYREKSSGVIKKLIDLGINIKLKKLDVGDYLLSENLCVEYKTIPDFVDSLIDKRIFSQIKNMKKYKKQIIILEGNEDIYSQRKIHPNAIRGMIAAICIDYNIPIIYTKNSHESALFMAMAAKREQLKDQKDFTMHSLKPLTLREQQEYIVSSFPGVGPVLSKPLLKKFKSIKNIVNASLEDLKKVDLIGEKKASKIKEVVESEYKEKE